MEEYKPDNKTVVVKRKKDEIVEKPTVEEVKQRLKRKIKGKEKDSSTDGEV